MKTILEELEINICKEENKKLLMIYFLSATAINIGFMVIFISF